jgi:hypothetical protein
MCNSNCFETRIFSIFKKKNFSTYFHDLGAWLLIGELDLLTTCTHHSELYFTDHWHMQTSVLSLLRSLLTVSWQWVLLREILQLPSLRASCHSCPCRIAPQVTTQLTGPQAGGHFSPTSWSSLHRLTFNWTLSLTTSYFKSFHSTRLLTTDSGALLTLFITFWHKPHRKQLFHCYSPTIPRPLHVYQLPLESIYRAVA